MAGKETHYGDDYYKHMREAEDQLNDDEDFEDNEDDDTPDYYWCSSCFTDYARKPIWGQCHNCSSYVEEGYY